MKKRTKFTPERGTIYANQGGGHFVCLASSAVAGEATMQNIKSGWTFRAHGCGLYEDGTMDWDYSTGGVFVEDWTEPGVYGYVDGQAVYSRDEFVFKSRGRGPIEDDAELLAFAEKVTSGWYSAGWRQSFTAFYLGDYALDEPKRSLTAKEYARLKELQAKARAEEKAADDARGWKLKATVGYADNSVEEIYEDKNGVEKRVMTVAPHGDAC